MTTAPRITDLDTANRRYAGLRAASDRFQAAAAAEVERLEKEAATLLAQAEGWRLALKCHRSLGENSTS